MKTLNFYPKAILSILLSLLTIFCIQISGYANNNPVLLVVIHQNEMFVSITLPMKTLVTLDPTTDDA